MAPSSSTGASAWDCHVHVFGPAERFALARERRYTPRDASPEQLLRLMGSLKTSRVVLVQASPYGDDHRCMLAGLDALGDKALGVAAMTRKVDPSVVGDGRVKAIRLNLHAMKDLEEVKRRIAAGARAAADNGWHLELHLRGAWLPSLALEKLPVDFVLDHMGRLASPDGEAMDVVLKLLESSRCWVKLSGADRVGAHAPRLARRLIAARPDRLVWGSDWPHTPLEHALEEARAVDTAALLSSFEQWAGAARHQVLAENPPRLYRRGAC